MSKYYGKVCYAITKETKPGVWKNLVVERMYYGDILRNTSRWQGSSNVNDDLVISNQISILADPFAYHNFHAIKYIEWLGSKWKVSSVEVQYPRLILNIGGVYPEEVD